MAHEEKLPDDTPSQAEFGAVVAYLAASGASSQGIRQAIGSGPNGRSRRQIAIELRSWLRSRPKA